MAKYSNETVFELVDLIYAAAGDPARWAVLLERLATILKGNIATLHHQHLTSMESSFGADWNMDPEAIAQYTAHYAPLNVWFTTHKELLEQGQVFTNTMLCSDDLLVRTEFYNDWLKPHNMGHALGAMVFKSGPATTSLSIFRRINGPPFGTGESRLLCLLMPHFQRAFQLHNRIHGLEGKAEAATDALNNLSQGVVILAANGRTQMINDVAAALFANDALLKLTPQGPVAAVPSENRRLGRLIQGALTTAAGKGLHPGGVMTISRKGLGRPLHLLVIPLPARTIHLGKDVPAVAVFISDPDRKPVSESQAISQLYGLSAAESRLALFLAAGQSLKDAAEQLGVAQSTLRSQLKSIFAKTNTSRQSQLVRLTLVTPSQPHGSPFIDGNILE